MSDRRLAHRLATLAALAVLVVIVASAWLRRSPGAPQAMIDVARIVHRIGATAALLVVVMIPFMTLRLAADRRERWIARVALAIVVVLALLGVATPGATSPFVVVGNLAGGYALFATLAVLAARLRERPAPARSRTLARIALAVTFGAVAIAVLPLPPAVHATLAAGALALALASAFAVREDRIVAATLVASAIALAATYAASSLVPTLVHNAAGALFVASLAVAAFPRPPD